MTTQIARSADDSVHSASAIGSKYRVEIDRNLCIGASSCVALAGNTFTLDENNKILISEGDWDTDELILAAAQSCPVFAIKIIDKETGNQIFPEV
jgi:ferredoxin